MGWDMFNFERLEVWHKAIEFADLVYDVTKTFPSEERFGLISQMRRAAVSVSSNVAEGTSRNSRGDYARFVEIACGSLFEVISQLFISRRQGYISDTDFERIYSAGELQGRMLSGLRNSLLQG